MYNLKRMTFIVIISCIFTVFFVGCGANQASDDVIIIGHDNNFVPFEYKDSETGEYVGFDIDFAKAIAEEAGFEYKMEPMAFGGLIPSLEGEKIDMALAGMTIKPDRAERVDFSQPYYDAGILLLVRADEEDIKSIEDLEGKVVASKASTDSYDFSKQIEGVKEVVPFQKIVEAYLELEKGAADAVLFDSPAILRYANNEGKDKVKVVGPLYQGSQYGIAFIKDSELREKVDEAIDVLTENGTYDDIYEKWFGEKPE